MKKLLLLPIILIAFACSSDEMEEERDTSTFTGLYDGYSWIDETTSGGVNQDETEMELYYIKDDILYFGSIYEAENLYGECEKEQIQIVSGGELITDGELVEIFFEVNTPEQLMIIFYYPEYDETFRMIFEVNNSILNQRFEYLDLSSNEWNEDGNFNFNETTSFTWENFEDFQCPN